ncbi:MAG: LptF/LptG family permease [Deltaproteobacteria bacterium]|nr:LptF/LptG family permease [Deltaproteobacteria bacterium]
MPRIDRHLLRQVAYPFVVAIGLVVALVFLFQARRLARAALGLGLTLSDVFTIFASALPPFLVLAIPIAFLLAVLLGLGRLSQDLEIVAIRASGATPLRIGRTTILLGAVVSLGCIPIAVIGEPYGLRTLHQRLVSVGLRNLSQAVRPGVFSEDFRGSAVYARQRSDDGTLSDVLLFDERDPERTVMMTARRGRVTTDSSNHVSFRLEQGEMHFGTPIEPSRYDRLHFERAELALDAHDEISRRTKFVSIIGRLTMTQMREIFENQDRDRDRDRADEVYARRVEQTYWRRLAFPSMAFVFGVVGAAIALTDRARSRARNAVIGILVVVAYYVSTRIADIAVFNDLLAPFVAAWLPNLAFLVPAFVIFMRSGRPK